MQQIPNRTIYCNDNLSILQGIDTNTIDLIYLDPPFNKKKIFTAPIGSSAEGASFSDIFREEDIKTEWLLTIKEDHDKIYEFLNSIQKIEGKGSYNYCYLAYMAIRLIECQRILKVTGSIYLHCDSTMSHYLKLLLDYIFGEKNFRNEIVWHYRKWTAARKIFNKESDTLLLYTKTNEYIFNVMYRERALSTLKRFGNKTIHSGKYDNDGKRIPSQILDKESQGSSLGNVWDISIIAPSAKERTGYPTQKPLALLERIVKASSNEGNIVLDPFCGCATTCIASEKLGRQWIGIDVSVKAYELVKIRLKKEVANPEDLFDYEKELNFQTTPPKRTSEKEAKESKYVYIISHPNFPNEYKVGIAKDWQSRLTSYQTSDPERSYKMEYKILTPMFRETEKHIHETFESKHEWVRANLSAIKEAIKRFLNG